MPDALPSRGRDARFQPGQSGNPGGRPSSALVQALARRYTVDALIAIVGCVRLTQPSYAFVRLAAAKALIDIGYPGLARQDATPEDGSALHLHLLAVMKGQPSEPTAAAAPVADDPPEDPELEPVTIDMDLLPEPEDDLPGAALPLWEAYRARNRAARPPESSGCEPLAPETAEIPESDTETAEKCDESGQS